MKYLIAYFFDGEGHPHKNTFDTELQAQHYANRHGLRLWKTEQKMIILETAK